MDKYTNYGVKGNKFIKKKERETFRHTWKTGEK